MLFAISAHFKPDTATPAHRLALIQQFNEHLTQRPVHLRLGGPLSDEAGEKVGLLFIVEAESRAKVDAFIAASPYTQAKFYDRLEINRFDTEIGSIN